MYKTTLKDIPSVSKVINELSGSINLHEDYLKKLVNEEISKIRRDIKKERYHTHLVGSIKRLFLFWKKLSVLKILKI